MLFVIIDAFIFSVTKPLLCILVTLYINIDIFKKLHAFLPEILEELDTGWSFVSSLLVFGAEGARFDFLDGVVL